MVLLSHNIASKAVIVIGDVHQCLSFCLMFNNVHQCFFTKYRLTSNKLYWIDNQLADVSTRFYTSASWRWRVGPSAS